MKTCSRCKQDKIESEFRNTRKGLYAYCRPCAAEYQRQYAKNYSKLSQVQRNSLLKSRYGITQQDYNQLLLEQGNRCAICKEAISMLDVDHDHVTGKIRGLLCRTCNRAIGLFKDNPTLLDSASKYLRKE